MTIGWWYVEDSHGKGGWAPATFLKPILDPELGKNTSSSLAGSKFVVITENEAVKPDELTIARGDKVTVIEASQCGWWKVR